jgi:hypothetical protein
LLDIARIVNTVRTVASNPAKLDTPLKCDLYALRHTMSSRALPLWFFLPSYIANKREVEEYAAVTDAVKSQGAR